LTFIRRQNVGSLETGHAATSPRTSRATSRSQARSGCTRRWGESDRSSCTAPIRTWSAA